MNYLYSGQHSVRAYSFPKRVSLLFLAFLFSLGLTGLYAANITVTSSANTGAGTLRDAITTLNGMAGTHNITFSVATVNLTSNLPAITKQINIDGGGTVTVSVPAGDGGYTIFSIGAGGGGTTLQGMTIQNTGHIAIRVTAALSGITLQNLVIKNNLNNYIDYAILCDAAITNMLIKNVDIKDIQYGTFWGLLFEGSVNGLTIDNVDLSSGGGYNVRAVQFAGATNNNILINNCNFDISDSPNLNPLSDSEEGDYGIYFNNALTNVTIDSVIIPTAEVYGIRTNTATNLTISNCSIGNSRGYGGQISIRIEGVANGVNISNTVIDVDHTASTNDGDYGIYFNTDASNVTLDGITMHDAEIHGFFVGGSLTNGSILNSTFDNFDGWGGNLMIQINGLTTNLTMTNVTIDEDITGTTDDGDYGIRFIGHVNGANITNVSVKEADIYGVQIWVDFKNVTWTGGTLLKNATGIRGDNCNYNRRNVKFQNMRIDSSTNYGVFMPVCLGGLADSVAFLSDTIRYSGTDGIYIHNGDNPTLYTIKNCLITGNGRTTTNGDGIQITAPDNVVLSENSIYDNAGLGINHTGNGNCLLEGVRAPIINSVTPLGGNQYQVNFTIPVIAAPGTFKVEFFTNNPVSGVEGEYYVSSVSGLSAGVGQTTIITTNTGPAASPKTANLTMTFTRTGATCNGTSEFSNAMALDPQGPACVNSGIVGWYRADKISGIANGQSLSQLLDYSGSGNKFRQFIAGEMPTYFSGDVSTNFNPSITFDGNSDNFEIAAGVLPINTGGTIYTAAYHANTANSWGDLYNQNIDDPSFGKWHAIPDVVLWDNGNLATNIGTMKWVNNISAIAGMDYGTTAATTHAYFNGVSTLGLGATPSPEAGIGYIGGENTGESWNGKIHEVIFYNRPLTATERQKINSYLSIKWGTSIDTSIMKVVSAANDYITSDGTIIWTANNTYYHRITGIGRDDCDSLVQKQSRNVNTTSPGYVTMGLGTIAATNASNPNNFAANKSFLVWADDGKAGSTTTAITGDGTITLVAGVCAQYSRLGKTFKIQETGTVGAVQVQVNMTGISLGNEVADYYLAINSTSTFTGTITKLIAPTSYTGNVLTFDNVDFTNGQFFTIIGKRVYGPANITSNLKLWLKADDGIIASDGSPVDSWADQGPAGNTVIQTDPAKQPLYQASTNLVNFNPSLKFVRANDNILYNTNGLMGASAYTGSAIFMVNRGASINNARPIWQPVTGWFLGLESPWGNGYGYFDYGPSFIGAPSGATVGTANIWTGNSRNFPSNSQKIFRNGELLTSSTGSPNYSGNNTPVGVGGRKDINAEYYDGSIPEVIVYSGGLSDGQVQKIQSYLAIKYGLTLDQTTAYNYLTADSTVVWNATTNAAYKYRITGIGRDDCSDLTQRQSRNQDTTSAYATMGLGTVAVSNIANTNNFSANKSFLLWGDDNVAGASATAITGDGTITLNATTCGVFRRLAKTFKVQETGTVGNVQVQVNLRGVSLGKVAADFYLAINSTATFNGVITKLVQASSYSGGVLTFNDVDLADGQFFTVIGQKSEGPANLTSHLKLWLRADQGVTLNGGTTTEWSDQGPAANNVMQATLANQPTYNTTSNLINFNPSLTFDGSNDFMRPASPIFGTGNLNYTVFGLVNSDINSGYRYWLSDGNAGCNTTVGFAHSGLNLSNVNWCNDLTLGSINLGQSYIEGFSRNATGTLRTNYRDGFALGTNTVAGLNKVNGVTTVGGDPGTGQRWSGLIGEIIAYDTIMSLIDQQKVNSYLAVKWGLTLDQSSPYNYLAANGTVIWDATTYAAYKNRITGIGRDDCSNLQQKQSKNQATGSLVTISNGNTLATTNELNTNDFTADNSWLLVGDNNKGLTWTGSGVPINGGNVRLNRVWRVEETGTVGTVYLEAPDNTSALPTKLPATTYNIYLLVANSSTSGRFNALSGVTVQQMTFDATNKKWFTTYNFTDGDYFTFGSEKTCIAPVGISEGLTAWYHATNMTLGAIAPNTANALSDQAFGVYPLNRNGVGTATVIAGTATSFNYNRSITLTGNAAFTKGSLTNADVLSAPAGSMFAVGTSNANLFAISSSSANISGLGSSALFNGTTSTYAPGIASTPNIYGMLGSTAGVTGYSNGTTGSTSGSIGGRPVATYTLGFGQNGSNVNYNNGTIAEAFTFDRALDAFEKDLLESYLAIKYGQTLNHNYYNGDYDGTNAATTTIYDISTYPNRVFGIGTDTTGCFHQKQSTSALSGSMLKIGVDTIAAENNSNTAAFLQDRAYVMVGDNNGSIAAWVVGGGANPNSPAIYANTCELPKRISRQWKATGTYTTPVALFAIPDATSTEATELPALTAGYSVWMVINEDPDFGINAFQQEVAMTLNATTKNWEGAYQVEAGKTKYITFVMKNDAIATGASQPTASIATLDNSCTADDGKVLSAGTATLIVTGANTYTWNDLSTNDTLLVNPIATTTYTVTATAANGCSDTTSIVVTVVSAPIAAIAEADISCTVNDGKVLTGASATLTASGGGTYTWDNASTAAIRVTNPVVTTTYTVTVSDANGCADTASTVVTIITLPAASIVETDNSCTSNDGKVLSGAAATLTASGGGTYNWDNASTAAIRMVNPLVSTTYMVTITDVNGCTAFASNTVTVVSAPSASIVETDNSCTVNDNKVLSGAAATLTASGGGTYTWDDASTAAIRMVNPLVTTNYGVTVTDANGCTATASSTITIVSAPVAAIVETDNSCTANDAKVLSGAVATLTASGGGTYTWDDASTAAIRVVNPVTNTTYMVTVTDGNGCTATASSSITIVTAPTASIVETDNSCTSDDGKVLSGATATLTASGGGTYTWDDASTAAIRMVNPVATTGYMVTVTDGNGCTATASNTVTVVSAPAAAIVETDNSCTSNDGKVLTGATATLTASGGGTYSWDDASTAAIRMVNPVVTTAYMVTVTDGNGCIATASSTVTIVVSPTATITASDNSCTINDSKVLSGAATTLTASGGGTYTWDNASTMAIRVVNPVATSTYFVTVTDANGCTVVEGKTITVVSAPVVVIGETDNSCSSNDSKVLSGGTATLTASGGTIYLWDNASSSPVRNVNPVATTTYMVTVTDINGCTNTGSATVMVVAAPTGAIASADNSCFANDEIIAVGGSATLTASGGLSYTWDDASTSAARLVSPVVTTIFVVTLTDANGCTATVNKTITVIAFCGVSVATKVFLGAVYDDGTMQMSDNLRSAGLIPLAQPYGGVEYPDFAHLGTEATTAPVLSITGSNAIVDWVIVEIRDSLNPITVLSRKAALLQRDGDIVDVDGLSPLLFTGINAGNYFVAVRHRNHLGVMTQNKVALSPLGSTIDFTLAATPNYQLSGITGSIHAQQTRSGGKRSLWAGNTGNTSNTGDRVIYQGPNSDVDEIYFKVLLDVGNLMFLPNYMVTNAYARTDANLDGVVVYQGSGSDSDVSFFSVLLYPLNNTLFLPNYTFFEQIPK